MSTSSAQIPTEFNNPNLEVLLPEDQIQERIKELGAQITRDYAGLNPLLIGVLKGACFFLSDLLRARFEAGCFNELSPLRAVRPCVGVFVEDCDMSSFVTKSFEEVPS